MLFFKEVVWLNNEVAYLEADTTKGIQVQIHKSEQESDIYWFEATNVDGIIHDSRKDEKVYSSQSDAEDAANEWFNYSSR